LSNSQPFAAEPVFEQAESGEVAARARQAFDVSGADRIDHNHKYDRHGAGHPLQRARGCARSGQDDVGGQRNQFRRVFASAASVRSPASVDARVAAVGPAQLLQRLYERRVAGLPFRIVRG
jgi:hypothetical protein